MSTDLYRVSVVQLISPTLVSIEIQSIYSDCLAIEKGYGFALMLLFEAPSDKGNKLKNEIDFSSLMNPIWAENYVRGFIESVTCIESIYVVPEAAQNDSNHSYFDAPEKWLKWKLSIKTTHEDWIEHLEAGQ